MQAHSLNQLNSAEAIILVKAFPQVGAKHGETVCVAGITRKGEWLRLFPVTFRKLEDSRQFKRWDIVKFDWRKPTDDRRPESRHVILNSLEIIGHVPQKDRQQLLAPLEVRGLSSLRAEGKSLALIRPLIDGLKIEKKTEDELRQETAVYQNAVNQSDLFDEQVLKAIDPCPYKFIYTYQIIEAGEKVSRRGTCQDWEIQATFYKWRNLYGEEKALSELQKRFGEEYPQKGMLFAMGTHSQYPDTWLINGIIRMDEFAQLSFSF